MKKTLISCLLFICTIQTFSQVFTGDLTLSTQGEIDAFNYTEVDGDLIIEESTPNEINNLNNLISLATISGSLIIQNNAGIINLVGLDNLTMNGGSFEIINNDNLINLAGVNSLTTIFRLEIKDNLVLSSIQDLSNVTGILGHPLSSIEGVIIENNDSLLNLDDLNIDQAVNLTIRNNAQLTSMSSFLDIGLNGKIYIEDNPLLVSIPDFYIPSNGLHTVSIKNNDLLTSLPVINKTITSRLSIDDNDNITSLTGLENASLGFLFPIGEMYITNNDNLITLDGLSINTIHTASIRIVNNDSLTNVDWFTNVLSNILVIDGNDSLVSLAPLSNFTSGALYIYGNTLLTNLDGLQNVESLWVLEIIDTNLSSLDSFNSLTSIGAQASEPFTIINNDNLTSLNGFENVTTFVAGNFRVTDNINLDDFCAFADLINNGGLPNGYFVSNNLYNPTISDFNNGNCSELSVEEFNSLKVTVYPNPTSDYLRIIAEDGILNCDIYSLTGQRIASFTNTNRIDVQHISKGVYFLKIRDSQNRTQTVRFIKE